MSGLSASLGSFRSFASSTIALAFACLPPTVLCSAYAAQPDTGSELNPLTVQCETGHRGGTLVISQHSEPKTLNPVMALDTSSKTIITLMTSDLIHVNQLTQKPEPSLAESWTVSPDARQYTLQLRRGVRFSDGVPLTADDVLFTWQVYLDEKVHAPQRDLLFVHGKPVSLRKTGVRTLVFTLDKPYAPAERLFDNIAILPKHLLERHYLDGTLAEAWSLNTSPARIAGLGPFRLKQFAAGEHVVLERNPYYWKRDTAGQALPYLDQVVSIFVPNTDAEAMRFSSGETDLVNRLSASNFELLKRTEARGGYHLKDLGPGLEYIFLFFNQNNLSDHNPSPDFADKQTWFNRVAFRQAVSSAIDRDSIIRLAFRGRAYPLAIPETPGNKYWVNRDIPQPVHSLAHARELLRSCGYGWTPDGTLHDEHGHPISFSVLVNATNGQQVQMATLIQEDLKQLGITVTVHQLEFHTYLDRIFTSYKYEAAIMNLVSSDVDPVAAGSVFSSTGSLHVWQLTPLPTSSPWQTEIDKLLQRQLTTIDYNQRRILYDQAQKEIWENMPVICLIAPHILVGAKDRIGNFRPALLDNYVLWNAEQIYIR